MKSPRLASMSLDALVSLRKKIDARITKAVNKERKRFTGLIRDLDGMTGSSAAPAASGS